MDLEAEVTILSAMMWGARVESLKPEDFSDKRHRQMYLAIRSGYDYDRLVATVDDDDLRYYIQDIYYAPACAPRYLREHVENLKRLALVRGLCDRVDRWRRRAPTLTHERAVVELGRALRGPL